MKKPSIVFLSLFWSLFGYGQAQSINYYEVLQLDTIPECRNRLKSERIFNNCVLKYFSLMSDRWFEDWSEVDKTYGHSVWFYGDCEDQRNFTFDSVAVNIHFRLPDYYSKSYMFTPSEVEVFFKKKKKK